MVTMSIKIEQKCESCNYTSSKSIMESWYVWEGGGGDRGGKEGEGEGERGGGKEGEGEGEGGKMNK